MTTKIAAIYAIRNIVNGKRYIGSTANLSGRKKKHLADLRRQHHHSNILQYAYNKYGELSFTFEIVEAVQNLEQLLLREQFYLDLYKPEYNVSLVANEKTRLGMKSSPAHIAKMKAALMDRAGTNKGMTFSKQHKQRIGDANKGKGRPPGFHLSEETKQKIREHHSPDSDRNLNRKGGKPGRKSPAGLLQHPEIQAGG